MRAFTKEWLRAVYDDLLTVEELIDNPNLTHILAFHTQECAEKLFKAILEINSPKIHKLLKLQKLLPVSPVDINSDLKYFR